RAQQRVLLHVPGERVAVAHVYLDTLWQRHHLHQLLRLCSTRGRVSTPADESTTHRLEGRSHASPRCARGWVMRGAADALRRLGARGDYLSDPAWLRDFERVA